MKHKTIMEVLHNPASAEHGSSAAWVEERGEPKIRTVLRSMISALDNGDDATYWKCAELLNKLHLEACSSTE